MRSFARWLSILVIGSVAYCVPAMAGVQFCDQAPKMTAAQKDHMLILSNVIKESLDAQDAEAAIISRSGIDLSRFDIRYSHAGVVFRDVAHSSWSVRQLYYECGESRPRIYDQGIPGFVLGVDDRDAVFLSVVFVSRSEAEKLYRSATDNPLSLQLLSDSYSANAYAFSTSYQNCNQWVAELLAHAWYAGARDDSPVNARETAQAWLQEMEYKPTDVRVQNIALMWLSHFYPYIHRGDHPDQNLANNTFRISMPASIEAFAMQQSTETRRMEFCLKDSKLVIHHGWKMLDAQCTPDAGDETLAL